MQRLPPQDVEAEMSVLGAMILGDRGAIEKATEALQREDFYRDAHGRIFEAMVTLAERDEPVDIVTLKDELDRRGILDAVGGIGYLVQLVEFVPTTANVAFHAKIVADKAVLRRLIEAAGEIAGLAYSQSEEVDNLTDLSERMIFNVARRRRTQGFTPLKPLLTEVFDRIDTLYHERGVTTGIDTGYTDLNYITSGFQPGDLVIIAARPSMGKCVAFDTLLDDPQTGERLTIEQWVAERRPHVLSVGACGRIAPARVGDWIDSGIKPVFRVTTRTGRSVEVTGHHPFLTVNGWTPLHDISVGTSIAVPGRLPVAPAATQDLTNECISQILQDLESGNQTAAKKLWSLSSESILRLRDIAFSRGKFSTICRLCADELSHTLLKIGVVVHKNKFDVHYVLTPTKIDGDNTDLLFDPIISIEPMGEKQVYDLTVPGDANFIAQDICVHNTALTLNIGQNASLRAEKSVAVFSLEMSKESLVQRMICSEARVDAHRLRTGFLSEEDWSRLAQAVDRLWNARLFIDDTTDVSSLEMRAKCRRLRAEYGLDMVIVDYMQLMRSSSKNADNRNAEITEIARGLKSLARELEVPVVALSQLSRSVERREDKRPMLSDLRDSGSIEAEADVVGFIYRPSYYARKEAMSQEGEAKADAERGDGEYEGEEAEVIIAKQRNGPTGTVKLAFLPKFARFENLAQNREGPDF